MKWMLLPLFVGLTAAFVEPARGSFVAPDCRPALLPAAFRTTAKSPTTTTTHLWAAAVRHVQVCGFKDCRRVGGGKKLESLVQQVLQENHNDDDESAAPVVDVEICDCLGECGYGPNLVVDGQIVNGVRGRQAVLQALGVAIESQQEA